MQLLKKGEYLRLMQARHSMRQLRQLLKHLKKGDTVTLVGFGTFSVKERAARTGRNPKTGEELQIKATKVPSFKAGKGLKDSVA